MKREDAKTHLPGITPEGLDWLMGENDADISREKARADAIQKQLDTANGQLQAAQAALKERDGQLETLRKSSGDAETLRQQIAQLQADNAAQQARQAEQLRAVRVDAAAETALRTAGAIDPAIVKQLMTGFLARAQPDAEGKIPGLAEEIDRLTKGEATGLLFRKGSAAPAVAGAAPAAGPTAAPDARQAGYAARLADARKAGNAPLAVSIKREAAAEGFQLL